ncbi:MAG: hypothetical protein EB059_07015 [Alphaproteobacteria bacterium]|nr:hypothetical protein [Alphaproteobacteria bacterium]
MLKHTVSKHLLILSALVVSAASLAACDYDGRADHRASDLPPGKYERVSKSTNAYGTTTEARDRTEVSRDEYGNKDVVVESETTKDPKGLFNKKTVKKTKRVYHEEDTAR